jgi:hypothetical protein
VEQSFGAKTIKNTLAKILYISVNTETIIIIILKKILKYDLFLF